jgi:hypothetical protein
VLAGVKSLTLHDRAEVALRDLGAQFYLTPADVGRNRAEACRWGRGRRRLPAGSLALPPSCPCLPACRAACVHVASAAVAIRSAHIAECMHRGMRSGPLDPLCSARQLAAAGTPSHLHRVPLSPLCPPPRPRSNPASLCREAVQELNTSVPVAASAAELDDAFLSQFQVGWAWCGVGWGGVAWGAWWRGWGGSANVPPRFCAFAAPPVNPSLRRHQTTPFRYLCSPLPYH